MLLYLLVVSREKENRVSRGHIEVISCGLGFRVSREERNIVYRDYIGVLFPYSLLTSIKYSLTEGYDL